MLLNQSKWNGKVLLILVWQFAKVLPSTGLRKHDVCFLVTIKAQMSLYDQFDWNKPFVPQVGLAYVRGCEIEGMLDEEGRVIEEGPEPKPKLSGKSRTFRIWLDTNQYQEDMSCVVKGSEDIYETFNVFMRRKPKENNFKVCGLVVN